jgi:hypothetical protein
MDWVASFTEGKPTKDEKRIHREQNATYKCPGCKESTTGFRPFSDHKRECNRFRMWLHKNKKSFSSKRADLIRRPFNQHAFPMD